MRKLFAGVSALALLLIGMFAGTGTASASTLEHFQATGTPTSLNIHIGNPPVPGVDGFELTEQLTSPSNQVIGSDKITCRVATPIPPDQVLFGCTATLDITGKGKIFATAAFASNQLAYTAYVIGGTGHYLPAAGSTIGVTEGGPGTLTHYDGYVRVLG